MPGFLERHKSVYGADPRKATLEWFQSSQLGLDLEYGVYSQLGRGPTVQFDERIPLARYGELKSTFDPSGFDANAVADLAAACGMAYVSLTARHGDGFCLFRTIETDFNSLEASDRDLLSELCVACQSRGLGLIVSFSYAVDWRHPYFFPAQTAQTDWRGARPAYESTPGEYLFEQDEDFLLYVRYTHHQLQEIAYRYRPLAGIRLEPVSGYHARPDLFPVDQTYSILREAQGGMLIAFGLGASGDEDFVVSESGQPRVPESGLAAQAWTANREKPLEITYRFGAGQRRSAADLIAAQREAASQGHNLLVRVRLDPDGSIDPSDEAALLELGRSRAAAQAAGLLA